MVKFVNYLKIILRGVSQVMLQNNPITGLLFLVGIFYNSWIMGFGALLGVSIGTLTAYIFKYNKEDINSGLYGFNGTLVGIALMYFFELDYFLILVIVVGAAVSSYIMNQMIRRKIPPYTFPFVVSTWVAIVVIKKTNWNWYCPEDALRLPLFVPDKILIERAISGIIYESPA